MTNRWSGGAERWRKTFIVGRNLRYGLTTGSQMSSELQYESRETTRVRPKAKFHILIKGYDPKVLFYPVQKIPISVQHSSNYIERRCGEFLVDIFDLVLPNFTDICNHIRHISPARVSIQIMENAIVRRRRRSG